MTAWAAPALIASAYYALALIAAAKWRRPPGPRGPGPARRPAPLSVLKPVRGRDPRFYEAIRSHAAQDYPEFEILFGMTDPDDPALPEIRRLQREFPAVPMAIHLVSTSAPNTKVGVLAELAKHARHPLLLVNDADILVGPGYFRAIAAPLAGEGDAPRAGLVTCLYRATGETRLARFEALGVSTEFAPSVLVARLLGVGEFALGATMAFRAATLRAIGGFEKIAGYLADDYQLGFRITQSGRRIAFAPVVVETTLDGATWSDIWRHQVRWARTVRVGRPGGYFGYGVTYATTWALVAFAAGQWPSGVLALALRMAAAVWIGAGILQDRRALSRFWLVPFRDLFGFAVWVAGLFGRTIYWRGVRLALSRDGQIRPSS